MLRLLLCSSQRRTWLSYPYFMALLAVYVAAYPDEVPRGGRLVYGENTCNFQRLLKGATAAKVLVLLCVFLYYAIC